MTVEVALVGGLGPEDRNDDQRDFRFTPGAAPSGCRAAKDLRGKSAVRAGPYCRVYADVRRWR
jgi:hypothetical protein